MALTLKDGSTVEFDLELLTVKEWRDYLNNVTAEAEDDLVERCAGKPKGWLSTLTVREWKRITTAFYKQISEPLSDPN